MMRFILLCFVFLGWAFYEFSGGSDFEPEPPLRLARYEAEIPSTPSGTRAAGPVTTASEPSAEEDVQLAMLETTTDANHEPTTIPLAVAETTMTPVSFDTPMPILSNPFASPTLHSSFTLQDASDETYSLAALSTPEPAPAPDDLRQVRASRVNMRNGPGTAYSVLVKLTRGQQVVVLQDPSTGWVKIRVANSGRIGWISGRLLENTP